MTRQAISTTGAPAALGPYSQAIRSGDLVFCCGPARARSRRPASSPTASRPRPSARCGTSQSVLDAAGLSFDDVVKTTSSSPTSATSRRSTRSTPSSCPTRRRPARRSRSAALPMGGLVEIEAIARRVQVDAVAR